MVKVLGQAKLVMKQCKMISSKFTSYLHRDFLDNEKINYCDLLGFSMGGKVSMSFCLLQANSEEIIRKLIVGDIAPVNHGITNGGVPHILNSIIKIDLSLYKDRRGVDQALKKDIPNDKERGFVLTNLQSDGDKLKWRANVIELHKNLSIIMNFPETKNIYRNPTLFMKGTLSNLVDSKYYERIQELFPNYSLSIYEGKGHWIHEEDPQRFGKEVVEFLDQ